jgi:hypothetical protein
MPRRFEGYEPDAIDCQTMCDALASDFGCICQVVVQFSADEVIAIAKCRPLLPAGGNDVLCQAIARRPLKGHGSLYVMVYSVLLDCWHQLDRGVLGAAARPIERGWTGRPQQPRRRT